MATGAVKVEGLKELQRAFRRLDKKLVKDFGDELKKAAEPVRDDARSKISRYAGASLGTVRVKRSGLTIFVEQTARKRTGKRGDYGGLQMRRGLVPALTEKTDVVVDEIDKVLARWGGEEGF